MMKKELLFPSTLLLLTLLHCTTTLAQSPAQSPAQPPVQPPPLPPVQPPPLPLPQSPAQGPAPPGPTNITAILESAGTFTTLIRLLKITQEGDRINALLNNSNQGLTVFAPTDASFSNLKSGTLNSLTDQKKAELVQFHVIPSFIARAQFQTLSNPLRTEAGDPRGRFPLNVTTDADGTVNFATGIIHATVGKTIYSDNQLAVYQVDKVLLPYDVFGPPAPPTAVAPAPVKASPSPPSVSTDDTADSKDASTDSSDAIGLPRHALVSFAVAAIASFSL